ncbi:MAG: hypothetical protein KL801_20540 [Mesorhizobium sp.]|nr:hypothetical protein [Mesorhizobium sp.]
MDANVIIALTNPAMSLIFAATFFLLWQHRRQAYIALLGVSFLAIGGGFFLHYFTLSSLPVSKLVANFLFLAGGVGFCHRRPGTLRTQATGPHHRFFCGGRL